MPTTECLDTAAAEELYKQLLRDERAAWDDLFARPRSAHQLRIWRRLSIQASQARTAFLQPSSPRGVTHGNDPESDGSVRQALKDAIQWQKVAWIAFEQSMRSGSGEDPQFRAVWLDAMRRVRTARKMVHAHTAGTPAAT